jgi:hypothetical protein
MINKRRSKIIEKTQFFLDKSNIVIEPSRPVSAHIVSQSVEH